MEQYIPAMIMAISPILVVVVTWITRRGLENKAAEAKTHIELMMEQRESFSAIIGPMQAGMKELREDNETLQGKVDNLTKIVTDTKRQSELLLSALISTLHHLDTAYSDAGPELDPRVKVLIEKGAI